MRCFALRSMYCLLACSTVLAHAGSVRAAPLEIFASAGFHDQTGLHSNPTPDSPYELGTTLVGQGADEPGWAGPWQVVGPTSVVGTKTDYAFEGDGALAIRKVSGSTPSAERVWSNITLQFGIEQRVLFRPGSGFASSTRRSGNSNYDTTTAIVWGVGDTGQVDVLDGPSTWEDTGFDLFPNTWYTVRVEADITTQTWEFFVNGEKYDAPDPLDFRTSQNFLDKVDYRSTSLTNDFYVDQVQITAIPEPSSLVLAVLGLVGLATFAWRRRGRTVA